MKRARARLVSSWGSCVALALSAKVSWAQSPAGPPAPAPAPPAVPAAPPVAPPPAAAPAPAATTPAPTAPVAPAPESQPPAEAVAPSQPVVVAPPPVEAPPPAPAPLPAAPPAPPSEKSAWYDGITFTAFADAYANVDFNFPKAPAQARQNPVRAYDNHTGFALNWAGLDVQKEAAPVGGMISLRFGPGAQRLAGACVDADNCDSESAIGLANVKQAFVSWKPASIVSFDLGKFDTPYGAEVADSQYNINYTRGVLYWLGQPAYHTGLRVNIDPARVFNLKLLAVNGWNRTIDNNSGKTFGLQGTYRLPKAAGSEEDLLTVALGYMMGPEHGDSMVVTCPPGQRFDPVQNPETGCVLSEGSTGGSGVVDRGSSNTKGLRHFLDLTAIATPIPALKLLLNASLGIDNDRDPAKQTEFRSASWFGVMAGARYAFLERLGLAARIEHYSDPDGLTSGFSGNDVTIRTATLTFDYGPAEHMLFFLDGRLDWSNKHIYPSGTHDENKGTAASVTLGAVVTTN